MITGEKRSAIFSEDRSYRYTLEITWDETKPICQWIGLNPSTATEIIDDPTLRRVKAYAKDWGMGGVVMTNLFAYRSTDPAALYSVPLPIGEEGSYLASDQVEFTQRNDREIYDTALKCSSHIACWGNHGTHMYRAAKVRIMFPRSLRALYLTGARQPGHPLYLRKTLQPFLI